uniref:Uncharacterized protein n=1 Tax=Sander lucioperca TaxID=283035 RepID=A0A8D0DEV2_SANLU
MTTLIRHICCFAHFIEIKRKMFHSFVCSSFLKQTTHNDVGISVDELDKFLQAPKAALHTAQQELGTLILGSLTIDSRVTLYSKHTPERSPEGREDGEGRHVIRLDEGPVSRHEVGTPEEQEDVVELQADQVFVVRGLSAVEGKKAHGVRAPRLLKTGRVVLYKDMGYIASS